MTTSTQQTVLTTEELACLRALAQGTAPAAGQDSMVEALAAKGMLSTDNTARHVLTPAGHHALNVDMPGTLPGIDS